jgi:hypothetical protein
MFNKLIPLGVAAVSFIAWEAALAVPQRFWASFFVFAAAFFFGFSKLYNFHVRDKTCWLLAVPPFFLLFGFGVLSLFLTFAWLAHVVIIIGAVAVYFYLRNVYTFLFDITRYRTLSLERFSSYSSVVSFVCTAIAAYGFVNFLNTPVWYAALAVAVAAFILSYQFFWVNKIDEQHTLFAGLLVTILAVEFFWAISFFPITHFISGLALGIMYYVVINLTLLHFLDTLERKLTTTYLAIGSACVLAILLSAKWL